MKTIIRISPHVADSPERIAANKLPMMGIRMLAEAYSERRDELGGDALLVLDEGKDHKPVYITVGSNPPELAIGGRRVFAVFSPPSSQEPIATFFERSDAERHMAWHLEATGIESKIGQIDSTDKPVVRVAVTAMIMHEGKILLGKLKQAGCYVLPEGELQVGESIESAVQRAVMVTAGLEVGKISVSRHAPYVSTFAEKAGQHFLTLVMLAEYVGGEPRALDPMWESAGWFDAESPPEPLFITVQQIIALAKYSAAPAPAPRPIPALPAHVGKPIRSMARRPQLKPKPKRARGR